MISLIALLGRTDKPVDGIEDYCNCLSRALERRGALLEVARVSWFELGWLAALRQLSRECPSWRGRWVILQFTALAWSRRGFPLGVLAALAILRWRGVRCAVMFHDPFRQTASGFLSRIRGTYQDWVVRRLYRRVELAIFADPLPTIPWLAAEGRSVLGGRSRSVFIPIGANIPECVLTRVPQSNDVSAVAIFCLSGPHVVDQELADIAVATRTALDAGARFRLIFLGRGTAEARDAIARAFEKIRVERSILGLLPPDRISEMLSQSSCLLCVRGRLYPRRGSAIAGVACGLPILGYAGMAEQTPLAEAGLILVPYRDGTALGAALFRFLSDPTLQSSLRKRSVHALSAYFSWDRIAAQFQQAFEAGSPKF